MRILIVCSGNAPGFIFEKHQAFIYDQVQAVMKHDNSIQYDYFFITQKGIRGYLSCLKSLNDLLSKEHFDCIHAHFATSALLANLQRKVPVIATFHGSDINLRPHRFLSLVVEILSKRTVYVSEKLRKKAFVAQSRKSAVIPCGVDFELFVAGSKSEARSALNLNPEKKYILFSSSFDNKVKNYPLASAAVELLNDQAIELMELKNFTRSQVAHLMPAVDVALMTSFSEGSPQFVKEALVCNCPVVSTDVGDVSDTLRGIEGCYVTSYASSDVADKLAKALNSPQPLQSRGLMARFDNRSVASRLIQLYRSI